MYDVAPSYSFRVPNLFLLLCTNLEMCALASHFAVSQSTNESTTYQRIHHGAARGLAVAAKGEP